MSISRRRSRRAVLASLGAMGSITGCLRLSSNGATSTPSDSTPADMETPTPASTLTDEPPQSTPTVTPSVEALPSSYDNEWAQFMFDAANTGYAPDTAGPTEDVEVAWRFISGMNADAGLAIADGTVFVGDWSDQLFALDGVTGELDWKRNLGGNVSFPAPAVKNGTVVLGTHDGRVYGVDAQSGAFTWYFDTEGMVWSSPTIWEDYVFVTSTDGTLYALSLADGSEYWRFASGDAALLASTATDGTRVYVGSADLPDSITIEDGYPFDPNVKDRWVGADGASRLYAVDIDTGAQDWAVDAGHVFVGSPAVANGRVYAGNYDGTIYALSAVDGRVQWTVQTDGVITATPAIAAGTVYIGSWDGTLYAVDADSGDREWIFPTESRVVAPVAVAEEQVYLNGHDGFVYGIEAGSGHEAWRVESFSSGPGGRPWPTALSSSAARAKWIQRGSCSHWPDRARRPGRYRCPPIRTEKTISVA